MKTTPTTSRPRGLLGHARLFVGALLLGALLTLGLRAALGPGEAGGMTGDEHAGHDHGAHVEHDVPTPPDQGTGLLIDLANQTCPVMGNPVSGHAFSEWNGLRIGHCCPGCDKQLAEDPEGFLDEAAPGWRDALAAVERVREARGAEREEALRELRENYEVVRDPEPVEPPDPHDDAHDHAGEHDHE